MRRSIRASALAIAASLSIAGVASAAPPVGPASCAGFLAAYANPNYGVIIQDVVLPLADRLDLVPGQLMITAAQRHDGNLWDCIPEL